MTSTDGAEIMTAFVPASPMLQHLGIQLEDLQDGAAKLSLPFAEHLVTVDQTVHGGAIATLADTAAMAAAWSGASPPESLRGSTVDLTLHYLAPAVGSDLIAHARVLHRGLSLIHVDIDVTTAAGKPTAHALATYKLG